MDIKELLSQSGIPTKESLFMVAPPYPYQVFFDSQSHGGADGVNCIVEHEIRLELYTEKSDRETECKIERLLYECGIEFTTDSREYVKSEDHYQKVYYFTMREKLR